MAIDVGSGELKIWIRRGGTGEWDECHDGFELMMMI